MCVPVWLSLLLSVPCQTSPPYCIFNLSRFCWKMEHSQCHLFTILHKYASLAGVFKRKGQALSEYGLPNYPSSLLILNLTNASLDLLQCCCYCSFLITVFNNDIYIFDRVMFEPRAMDVCVPSLSSGQHNLTMRETCSQSTTSPASYQT